MARSGQGQQDEAIRELTRAILNATRERKATTKTAKETKGGGGGGIRAAIGGAALSTGLAAAGAVASTVTRALEASLKSPHSEHQRSRGSPRFRSSALRSRKKSTR